MDMDVKSDLEELVSKIVIKVIDKYMKEPFDKIHEILLGKIQPAINKLDELEKRIGEINTKMDESVPVHASRPVQASAEKLGGNKNRQPRNYTSSKKQNRKKRKYSNKRLC